VNLVIFTPVRLFGEALAKALSSKDGFSVRAICYSAAEVAYKALETEADLVLYDMTPEEALVEVRSVVEAAPDLPVIAIALEEQPQNVIACADAGIAAYVPRDVSVDSLEELMLMTLRGETSCHPKVVTCLMRELRRRKCSPDSEATELLTRREAEVLHLVGRGLANKQVATALHLSISTVKAHLHNVFTKLNVSSRSEAIACLRQRPWLASPGPRLPPTRDNNRSSGSRSRCETTSEPCDLALSVPHR